MDQTHTMYVMAARHSIADDMQANVESYREKLIIIYCSGCKSVQSKITTDFFNTLGNDIENVEIARVDLSRSDDPLNLIRGFIHPKYLIKESLYSGTPAPISSSGNYEYNIDGKLKDYFYQHNDEYGRRENNRSHICQGPDLYTSVTDTQTIVSSVSNNLEYEESEEYLDKECDYFLVYKTPTILFEIYPHAYIKFQENFPIDVYPCSLDHQQEHETAMQLYVKKIKYWIKYLKEFKNKLIGLYYMLRIDIQSSCRVANRNLITGAVTARDAYYNVVGKYYDILCNAYPKTEDHVTRLEVYTRENTRFYQAKDSDSIQPSRSADATDLDYLKVDRTRVPVLNRNQELLLTDPENCTIRGNYHRIKEFAERTLIISFDVAVENQNPSIALVDQYCKPHNFMTAIKNIVDAATCSNPQSNLRLLKSIFKDKGFPNEDQIWR